MSSCSPEERAADPLLRAARDYNHLRARDPRHAADLIAWTDSHHRDAGPVRGRSRSAG